MNATIQKRVEALEAKQSAEEPIIIIRVIALPGDKEAEPAKADVGGRTILRADDETGEAFLARVRAEAELAARPGCVGMALVWPTMPSDDASAG